MSHDDLDYLLEMARKEALSPLEKCEAWLIAHPRGEIRMRAAGEIPGFIVERSCPDIVTGNECADASHGFHPELFAALAACVREGE